MTATEEWARALAEWALPEEILAAADESPWGFAVEVFVEAARRSMSGPPTPTHRRVAEALPEGGVLLDVGCGAGAASLPVAPPAGRIVAVDQEGAMLDALAGLARDRVRVEPVAGGWPDVAARVGEVDVAVCANVAYNVADLGPFVRALTGAARRRVVLELSAAHPQSPMSPLWLRFWGLARPVRPTWQDAVAVVRESLGVDPEHESWRRERPAGDGGPQALAWIRRRLCLPEGREAELAEAVGALPEIAPSRMVTLWWPGGAG